MRDEDRTQKNARRSAYNHRTTHFSRTAPGTGTWVISENDFYSSEEVKVILNHVKKEKEIALKRSTKTKVKEWMLINLAFGTGLRVSEMAKLKCEDLFLTENFPFVFVRQGKGGKPRQVLISKSFKDKLEWFLSWKKKFRENISETAPLLLSSISKNIFSTRGLEVLFKRVLNRVEIQKRNNIHMARHTYATALLRASGNNLLFVKEQLGHSSIAVTQAYLHVVESDARKALEKLYLV